MDANNKKLPPNSSKSASTSSNADEPQDIYRRLKWNGWGAKHVEMRVDKNDPLVAIHTTERQEHSRVGPLHDAGNIGVEDSAKSLRSHTGAHRSASRCCRSCRPRSSTLVSCRLSRRRSHPSQIKTGWRESAYARVREELPRPLATPKGGCWQGCRTSLCCHSRTTTVSHSCRLP